MDFKAHIRTVPDFPTAGIEFFDISTLLGHAEAWAAAVETMAKELRTWKLDHLLGIESRGFLLAAPLAKELGLGFSMIRKPGKLPGETVGLNYALEYGEDRLEIQADALKPGARVAILDDLLATGGTISAAERLVAQVGGDVVGLMFMIELGFLKGRARCQSPIFSLMTYD